MKLLASFLLFLLFFFSSTKESNAIIIVVPVILIPIVKIVALIITAIATPVLGLSTWYLKLKKKSILFGIFVGMIILILVGLLFTLGIKIVNPSRPLY